MHPRRGLSSLPHPVPSIAMSDYYVISPLKCFLFGVPVLAYGLFSFLEKRSRLRTWTPTTATVTNTNRDANGHTTIRVKYTAADGKLYTASMAVADGDRIGLGSEIKVAYHPLAPENAFIAEKKDMNLGALLAIASGAALVGLGILGLVLNR